MPRYYIFGGCRIDDQFFSLITVSDTPWCLNWAFGIQPGRGAWVCPSGATSSSLSLLMQLQFTVKGSAFPPSSDATSDRWMALVTEFIPARKTSKSEHRKVISRKLHACRWPFDLGSPFRPETPWFPQRCHVNAISPSKGDHWHYCMNGFSSAMKIHDRAVFSIYRRKGCHTLCRTR